MLSKIIEKKWFALVSLVLAMLALWYVAAAVMNGKQIIKNLEQ